jgi:hypothetical protein
MQAAPTNPAASGSQERSEKLEIRKPRKAENKLDRKPRKVEVKNKACRKPRKAETKKSAAGPARHRIFAGRVRLGRIRLRQQNTATDVATPLPRVPSVLVDAVKRV